MVMPKDARETLRRGGGIPESFWGALSGERNGPILEWPFELDYGAVRNSDGRGRPVDLSEFFGLGISENDARKRANERLLAPLLNRPMVLVAFLDSREEPGGYARFRSFREISCWARQLDEALKHRFPNEESIGDAARTLVLVAREEQVRATNTDLKEFTEFVGNGRVFRSVYYIGRNLQMENGALFHSMVVWDVMVARLLTAFVLSENENPSCPFYLEPGLKVWRSCECVERHDPIAEAGMVNLALSKAADMLKGHLVPGPDGGLMVAAGASGGVNWAKVPSNEDVLSEMDSALDGKIGIPGLEENGVLEEWRREPCWGWSDFKARQCLRETRDDKGERWRPVLERWKSLFPVWRRAKRESVAVAERKERKDIYDGVGTSAANVTPDVSELRARLDAGMGTGDPVGHWLAMAKAAGERAEMLAKLEDDATEFELARRRYAGLVGGLAVFLSVTLAWGWAGYFGVSAWAGLTGKSLAWVWPAALAVSGCFALGAFAAIAWVTWHHYRAGSRGMEELIKKSLEADAKLLEQSKEARQIVSEGVAGETGGRFRAERFRAWVLLKRLQTMLDTELSPRMIQGRPVDGREPVGGNRAENQDDEIRVRADFLRKTRAVCVVRETRNSKEVNKFAANETYTWWANTFQPLWRKLRQGDIGNAGHYPARKTVPALRQAVAQFIATLRVAWRQEARTRGSQALQAEMQAWVDKVEDSDPLQYASAATTGEHTSEGEMEPASIYCHPDFATTLKAPRTRSVRGGYELKSGGVFKGTEWLGLMYQEWRVEFDLVSKEGILNFKVVPDA